MDNTKLGTGKKLGESRTQKLLAIKDRLDTLSKQISNVIDGTTTQTAVAEALGLKPQSFSSQVTADFKPYIRKHFLSDDEMIQLMIDGESPCEKLIDAVFHIPTSGKNKLYLYVSKEEEAAFMKRAQEVLSEREWNIIMDRYGFTGEGDCLTYDQLGEKYHISHTVVQRNENYALRKLRRPDVWTVLLSSEQQMQHIIRDKRILKAIEKYFPEDGKELQEKYVSSENFESLPIDVLRISTRTCNCLKRHGIHTIGDAMSRTYDEIANYYKLGASGFEETVYALADYGIILSDWN